MVESRKSLEQIKRPFLGFKLAGKQHHRCSGRNPQLLAPGLGGPFGLRGCGLEAGVVYRVGSEKHAPDTALSHPGGIGLAHRQAGGEAAKQQPAQELGQQGLEASTGGELVRISAQQQGQMPQAGIEQQAQMAAVGVAKQQHGIRPPAQQLADQRGVVQPSEMMGAGIAGAISHEGVGVTLQQRHIPLQLLAKAAVALGRHAEIPEIEHLQQQARLLGQLAEPGGVVLNRVANHHRQADHASRRLLAGWRPNHQPTSSTTTTI